MKKLRKFFGFIAIVLFLAMEAKILFDEGWTIQIANIVEIGRTITHEIFNLTSGNAFQHFVKFSVILFIIGMIALPIAGLTIYFHRKKQNKGLPSSFFITKFILALIGIFFVISNYRFTDEDLVCVLMLIFIYFAIVYFIISIIEVSKSKAIINIDELYDVSDDTKELNEELKQNLEDESIDIENSENEIKPVEELNDSNFEKLVKSKTFVEKFNEADEQTKKNYSILKNELMRFERMRSRVSKSYESFHIGNIALAKIAFRGKKIKLYLALDPESIDYGTYHQQDVSEKKKYASTPSAFSIKSNLSVKKAQQLIKFTCGQIRAEQKENYTPVDYTVSQFKENAIPENIGNKD